MSRCKLFTHTDLDGVGCAIVAYHMLDDVDVEYCDYDEINERVTRFIENGESRSYRRIFITDISVNETVASLINQQVRKLLNSWRLIDHHQTAEWLNKYAWAWVETEDPEGKASGTSLFYNYLKNLRDSDGSEELGSFVEKVRRYDTWEWKTMYHDEKAKELNNLLSVFGRDRFVERYTNLLDLDFLPTERIVLELENERVDSYVEQKSRDVLITELLGYPTGVVFADRYQSDLGNRIAEPHPELDVIAMVNPGQSVSLRTKKDDVDVGEIARHFGGGGHPNAAGFPLSKESTEAYIRDLFEE